MRRATDRPRARRRRGGAIAALLAALLPALIWLARDRGPYRERDATIAPAARTDPGHDAGQAGAAGTETETAQLDAARAAESPAPATAADLLHAARAALPGEPERALSLIEEADARFGDDDEARRVLEIETLVALGQIGRSRALTRHFYQRYPDSEAIPDLERLTGYHPRPEGPGPR